MRTNSSASTAFGRKLPFCIVVDFFGTDFMDVMQKVVEEAQGSTLGHVRAWREI